MKTPEEIQAAVSAIVDARNAIQKNSSLLGDSVPILSDPRFWGWPDDALSGALTELATDANRLEEIKAKLNPDELAVLIKTRK